MRNRLRELARAILRTRPTEELLDDIHLRVQVGNALEMGITFHVLEQNRETSIEMLLHSCDLEIGIDGNLRFEQFSCCPKPFDHSSQRAQVLGARHQFMLLGYRHKAPPRPSVEARS